MISIRALSIQALCAVLATALCAAADLSSYRGFKLGMSLPAAKLQAGTQLSEARTIHQRPAMIQEVDWQPRVPILGDPAKADSIKEGLLTFYNGELFRIVITYDRYRVEGLTAEDMTTAISAAYGTPVKPATEIAYHSNYAEVAAVLARWEDSDYSYNLVRTGDRSSFAMVLYSKRLDALAQASIVEARRLEALAAPQKEIDLQKKQDEEIRLGLEKARSVNKPNFRP